MSTNKHFDIIAFAVILAAMIIGGTLLWGSARAPSQGTAFPYEDRLFDTSYVHSIDIALDDPESFLATCAEEEYTTCTVTIDGEVFSNVGIRGKGNTSLSSVASMDSDRYSFKLEFDHYNSAGNYYGLDKLVLNNLIQDNTMMKDHLTYRMMDAFGAAAPLSSYSYITINGEGFGLYLAVEAVEDSFLLRNYGSDYGELYKPDSMSMGKDQDMGMERNFGDFTPKNGKDAAPVAPEDIPQNTDTEQMPASFDPKMQKDSQFSKDDRGGMGIMGGMGSSDTKLQYIDDSPESYSNIFNSAKTDITAADQERLICALKSLSAGTDPGTVVDIDAVMRYFVVHNYVVNGDSYTGSMVHNYYLYEEDGILSMLPWDYNLAFGSFQGTNASAAVNDPIDTPLSVSGNGDRPMADWIFRDETYKELYHQYFSEFLERVDAEAMIEETRTLIQSYVEQDPTKFCSFEEFEAGVDALITFCSLRSESVLGQLNGSIPTTAEAQKEAEGLLIETGTLSLSDTGSMGMDRGHDTDRDMARPDTSRSETKETGAPPSIPASDTFDQTMPATEFRQNKRDFSADVQPTDIHFDRSMEQNNLRQTSLPMLAVCFAFLALGLAAAFLYKRH